MIAERLEVQKDADRIIAVLLSRGPRDLPGLRAQPEFDGWELQRIERAVVAAWAAATLSLDEEDRLIALRP